LSIEHDRTTTLVDGENGDGQWLAPDH